MKKERQGTPVLSRLVEVLSHETLRLHSDVAASVDALLAGKQPATQLRTHKDGRTTLRFETPKAHAEDGHSTLASPTPLLAGLAELAKAAL